MAEGDAPTTASAALAGLPPEVASLAVDAICAKLTQANIINVVAMCAALLVIVLADEPYDGESPLSDDLRKAIHTICEADNAWELINIKDAFEGTGLSADRQELRALLLAQKSQ